MPEKKLSDFRAEWDALKVSAVAQAAISTHGKPAGHPDVEAQEAACALLATEKDAFAHRAWLAKARDLDDLELLAEVAFEQFGDITTLPQFPANIEEYIQDGVEANDSRSAVAYLMRGVFDVVRAQRAQTEAGRSPQPGHDWLALLRDAGPDGAAPDARHAVLWGAILDLRWCRDTIENTVEQMTKKLDRLADETALTHAIAACWKPADAPEADEPEEDATAEVAPARAAPAVDPGTGRERGEAPVRCNSVGYRLKDRLRDKVDGAWSGVTTLHTLVHAHDARLHAFDPDLTASLHFCIGRLGESFEEITELLDDAEVRPKAST